MLGLKLQSMCIKLYKKLFVTISKVLSSAVVKFHSDSLSH